ncbi:MAG: TetR/AcrR family transcriptional regulator [Acidimicrobiia bacterium]
MTSLRETHKAFTRRSIEDAAWSLFAGRSYEDVTLAEVADAAGVALRTVYRYFPHKDALLDGDHEAALVTVGQALAAVPPGTPLSEVLRRAAAEVVNTSSHAWDPDRARLAFSLAASSPAVAARLLAHEAARTAVLSAEIARRLGCGPGDLRPAVLAAAAGAAIREALTRWLEHPGLDPAAVIDEALAIVAGALDAHPTVGKLEAVRG